MSRTTPIQVLRSGSRALGIELSEDRVEMFEAYTRHLLEWNQRLNLTRIVEPLDIIVRHYLDSLSLFSVVNPAENSAVIDVGTGAGMPGIALKIVRRDLQVTLLDSLRKRLTFLEHIVSSFGLEGVEVVHSRAEDAGRDARYREKYDLAVSRAVASLNVLSEFCLPLCRVGGTFAAYKGPSPESEVAEASGAVSKLGGKLERVHKLTLGLDGLERSLVIVGKTKHTPAGYPRKAGIPEKNPI